MRIIFLFIFLILLEACKDSSEVDGNTETVHFRKANLPSVTDLIDHIRIVRLEHGDSLLLGRRLRMEQKDSAFYIADFSYGMKIFRFGMDGRYLNTIGQTGKGPGEYPVFGAFQVAEKADEVYVLSFPASVYRYTKEGKYKGKIVAEASIHQFLRKEEGFIGQLYGIEANKPCMVLMDSILNITDTLPGVISGQFNARISWLPAFSPGKEGNSYCWQIPYPAIYQLRGDSIERTYRFDLGSEYATDEELISLSFAELRKAKMLSLIVCCLETDKYLLVGLNTTGGERKKEVHVMLAVKDKQASSWRWLDLEVNHPDEAYQKVLYEKAWFPVETMCVSHDDALACFMSAAALEKLPEEAKRLIVNPDLLENVNPEMDIFVLMCYLK